MVSETIKQPPLVKAYIWHGVVTAIIGLALPFGVFIEPLYSIFSPVTNLIPNAARLTSQAPDEVFAKTFIGLSIVIALIILVGFVFRAHEYHTRTFASTWKKARLLALAWIFYFVVPIAVLWFLPYGNPASKGRAYYLIEVATSGNIGVVIVLNQLIVGIPLIFLLGLWAGHACTTVRQSSSLS